MDSKKALKILIILLVVVNLFMAGYIISLTFSKSDTSDENKYITSLLTYRDITLECEIPDYPAPSAVLIAKDPDNSSLLAYLNGLDGVLEEDVESGVIVFSPTISERIDDFTLDTTTKQASAFITSLPIKSEAYMLDSILTTGVNIYKFNYIYADGSRYIYDKSIEITISKNGIDQVVISNINYIVSDTENNRPMVSIGNILVSGFTRQGQASITIKKMDTGYLYDTDTLALKNVWRIMFNNGQVRYFSSIDGIEITTD